MLRIDIGCGGARREGYVGVDREPGPCVDHVLDFERDALPFPDRSVEAIFSSHCLEHLSSQALVFREMSRVAQNGAPLEIWTPYTWSDEAFLYTHRTFFNELHFLHPCHLFPEHYDAILGARWQLREIQFVVPPETVVELRANGFGLDFALRYLKGVAREFGVHITIWHEPAPPPAPPRRTWSHEREGTRLPLEHETGTRAVLRGDS
jgi:predicted SAM-dependent methyltransferase